jgi:small-conductance mechanosensitive channel
VIRVLALGDSRISIAIQPWTPVEHFYTASSDVTQAVLEIFRARGIRIPVPQRDVRLLNPA